ncbi:hypothetical protein PS15m_006420 [Mucor circinelloides]
MKDELREHKARTSNAIEAFHSALYKSMRKRQPITTSLRLLLQVAQRDGVMLVDFFENQVRLFYGKKKKSSTKKYATLYEINDGRPPDNNTALFGVKKRKQEVVIIDDDEESKPKAKKTKRHDIELNAALEEYLDEVDKTCLKVGAVNNDDVMDEKLFLELLQTGDVELISEDADNEFERTEDLDKDIKNMFNELGINVEDTFESDEKYESCVIDLASSSSSSSPSSPETADTTRSQILSQAISESYNSQPLEPSSNKSTEAIDILSDSKSSSVDELILPEKWPHLLQKYRYIAHAYDNKTREEHPSLAMNVYIRSNQNNSCFIDASFELLFNAVLPFIDMSCIDSNNNYDCLLKDAFDLYSLQTNLGVDTAIGNVRNFVWNMEEVNGARKMVKSFPKGREGDNVKLLSIILERLSDVFAKKICAFSSMKCERKISCSAESSYSHTRASRIS